MINTNDHEKALIGILMLETTFPRIPGDIGNPETFPFPVAYRTVRGASIRRVVMEGDHGLIAAFIEAGQALVARGVKAITTSCGFMALFHRQLVDALPVPVYTSSLLQVHLFGRVIRGDRTIGIITAREKSLTDAHFAGVGIQDYPMAVVGMDEAEEFSTVFIDGKRTIDENKCRLEMESAALKSIDAHPDVGAIVLECTNMPPYADTVRQTTGLPVFDVVTMVNQAYDAVAIACSQRMV